MKKQLFALLFLASSFATSPLVSLTPKNTHVPVLRNHGHLYFDFDVAVEVLTESAGLKGKFQTFIIAPNMRKFKGPIIDASAPRTAFKIIVNAPILLGPYTIVVKNIDVKFKSGQPFVGNLVDANVTVTNSFNSKVCSTVIQSLLLMGGQPPLKNFPRHSVEGIFIPPTTFISG